MGFRRAGKQEPTVRLDMVDESLQQAADWKPNGQQLMIMLVLSIISMMVSLDATIIVTSLSSIIEDLDGTTTQGIWVGTAYLLSQAVAMPFLSSLSDIFGRPILLLSSVSLFAVGSIVCATSHTIGQLLAGRAVQGTGGGGIVVISLVTFCDIVPLRFRPKWYGTVQGAWALGTCIGPILGGVISENTTWRWVFYIMLPFCALGLIGIPLLLSIEPRVETMGAKLKRVDYIGSFIFMSSATSFLIAISWGGTQFAWSSAATVAPLVVGAAGLLGTALWERYAAEEPFMRHSLFTSASAVATYVCSAAQGLLLFGQLYYIPFYFMAALEYSPVRTGVATLPVMLVLVPSSVVTGVLITRFNNYRYPIWLGWAVTTVGCGLLTIWDDGTHVAVWAISLIVLGFGHGAVLNAQNFAAQAISGAGDEAHAAAMYAFMRHFGMALGVGIGGTTFQNVMAQRVSSAIASNAEGFLPELLAMPAGPDKDRIVAGYVFGFKGVFRVYLGVAGVSFLVSLLIRYYDMNKELRTEHRLQDNRFSRMVGAGGGQQHHAAVVSRVDGETDATKARVPGAALLVAVKEVPSEGGMVTPASDTSSVTRIDVEAPPPVALKREEEEEATPRASVVVDRPATARSAGDTRGLESAV